MELAASGKHPYLNLLVRHDDSEREFAYDENAGKIFAAAQGRGWTIASMRRDFDIVFPFQK
jgi:hypothetical protein